MVHTYSCKFLSNPKLQHKGPSEKLSPLKNLLDHGAHGEILADLEDKTTHVQNLLH
jgi:hypothetical protein